MQRRNLKIAMVAACPFPANHGSAASIREMSEALVALGHEVHVLTYPMRDDTPVAGVHIHRVSVPFMAPGAIRIGPTFAKPLYDVALMFKLIEVIRRHRIDVIHAHNYEAAVIGWVGKKVGRRPLLYNAVTNMRDELPTYDFIRPRRLAESIGQLMDDAVPRGADIVTVVSDELGDYLVERGISRRRIRVVPAGVNVEMFSRADGERIRARHRAAGVPLVMYTGAFEQFQRIDYLLLAMQRLLERIPSARLLLVGNVQNAANLRRYREMAAQLNIAPRVEFLDSVPLAELPDYLAAADVAVVPRTECPGHPVKLLNYMAAAKPIVSFKGAAKGLHHMHNAYLAEDHDCAALGQGIAFLLERPDIARALGARARDSIEGVFDWASLARGIEVLYWGMLEGEQGMDAANPFLKSRYVLQYVDRRSMAAAGPVRRSAGDRRKRDLPIEMLERRKVAFPPSRAGAGSDPRRVLREAEPLYLSKRDDAGRV